MSSLLELGNLKKPINNIFHRDRDNENHSIQFQIIFITVFIVNSTLNCIYNIFIRKNIVIIKTK